MGKVKSECSGCFAAFVLDTVEMTVSMMRPSNGVRGKNHPAGVGLPALRLRRVRGGPVSLSYDFLDDVQEREWLIALDPQDVVANAHRWYEWAGQFGGGLCDSFIRELAFQKAADALGIDYGDLYNSWLDRIPMKENT